jgi:hypothetical protein
MTGYFSIKMDMTFPCFCSACLVGKTANEQSPDPRYCQSCYEFLLKEASLLDGSRRPAWIPKDTQAITRTLLQPSAETLQAISTPQNDVPMEFW